MCSYSKVSPLMSCEVKMPCLALYVSFVTFAVVYLPYLVCQGVASETSMEDAHVTYENTVTTLPPLLEEASSAQLVTVYIETYKRVLYLTHTSHDSYIGIVVFHTSSQQIPPQLHDVAAAVVSVTVPLPTVPVPVCLTLKSFGIRR